MGRPLDEDIIIKILERWQKAFKENSHYVSASDLSLVIKDVRELPTIQSVATDTNVGNNSEIPNSSDAISRQWLLDCINDGWIKFDTDKDVNRFIHLVRDIAPTIQPEPKWIPVSERLPEDMQFVLLTVRRLKAEYNHEPFISVGYIGWNQTHWWCAHDGDCEISKIEVIAWMPLLEPYKPNNK